MREIKFRAWFKDKQEMSSVATNNIYEGNTSYMYLSPMPGSNYELVKIMQYTGLKDKNGKEIYEKDIVDFDGKKHMVTFANGGFGIWKEMRTNLYSDETRKYHEPLWNLVVDGCEIIGNIYENPELIK